jgi:hypothetical protein
MLMSHDPSTDIMPASRTAGGFRRTIDEIEDETGLEAKVEAGADNIKIELKRGAKMVGYFRASTVSPDSFQWKEAPLDCKEAWSQIGEPPVWIVRGAEWFDPDLRGKGFGKLLYKALFSYIASKKGVVGPNRCSGGNTSPDAQRVWKSLRSMYPKHGPLIDLRKRASASRVASRYAGGFRTLYYIGKRPAAPKPKRAEWRGRGQDTPDWVRPWLDAPVSKGVFLTPNPMPVASNHGVFGHVYAYKVPEWVIKEAKGLHRMDRATEILIPEPLWKHIKFMGKSMDKDEFLTPSRVAARWVQAGLDDDYVELLRKKISLKEFLKRQPKIKAVDTQRLDALPDSGLSKGYDYDCFVHAELRAVQLSDAKSYREVDWEPVGIDGAGTSPPMGAEIPWSKAKRGDWVRWPGLGGHHGVVIDPKRKIVESCWGYKGIVFQHPIDQHPYGKGGKVYPVRPKEAATRVASRYITAASLSVEEYYGKKGRKDHITRYEKGTIPTKDALKIEPPRQYHGKRKWSMKGGERYFGSYTEERWNEFLEDIRKNGIQTPLWIQKDPGEDAALMEGNHRVQAADQLGIREVPVYIRYYGLSEEDGLAAPSVRRTIKHQDPERVKV